MQSIPAFQRFATAFRPLEGAPPQVPFGPAVPASVCDATATAIPGSSNRSDDMATVGLEPTGCSQGIDLSRVAHASAVNQGPTSDAVAPRVFRIGKSGVSEVTRRRDGGYRVEGPTATVVYWGKDATKYLAGREHFAMDTEVVIPRGTRVRVTTDGKTHETSEPGAILLGAGSVARVDVLEGEPMVIRSQNAPVWYGKLGPAGDHRNNFEELAHINAKLYNWHTHSSRFSASDLEALKSAGVVRDDPEDGRYVQWQAFPSPGGLRRELENAQVSPEVIDRAMPVYEGARQRRLYEALPGRIGAGALGERVTRRLVEDEIATRHPQASDDPYWSPEIVTEQDLAQKLSDKGYAGPEVHDIIAAWHKTTRSGYDNTGLAFESGKVVAYNLGDKINMWNGQETEWMVNSTAYAGENEPFTVGVSYVQAKAPRDVPTDFHEIRPLETLHRHPATEAREQTEAYMVRSGRAALVTVTDRGPEVHVLEAGDMAIVEPDVVHCVSAFEGPYEHLCAQVPSAFQYGFMFKDTQDFGTYGLTEAGTTESARAALASGKSGTMPLGSFQASTTAPAGVVLQADGSLGFCLSTNP